jgi:hypothetical protein
MPKASGTFKNSTITDAVERLATMIASFFDKRGDMG